VTGEPAQTPELLMVAHGLKIDGLAAKVSEALEAEGVPCILLKGRVLADWLYDAHEVRTYGDADLMVSPSDWTRAKAILTSMGFEGELDHLGHPRMESYTSYPFIRGEDHVDLHCTLWGVGASPQRAWEELWATTEPKQMGGRTVPVLGPAARAMHVALHAVQHGVLDTKMTADLERAVERLPLGLWEQAAALALRLDAAAAFATGLRMVSAGRKLSSRLGLDGVRSVRAELCLSGVPLAQGFEHLAGTRGLGTRLKLVARELVPNPAFMRWWSPRVAQRGVLGLGAAYLWRIAFFARHAVPGFVAWRRARRSSAAGAR
jgi:putative nucleotidyltransferase-like protein